jgi:hypothetical protein
MRLYIFLITISLFFMACGGGNTETPKNGNVNIPKPTNSATPAVNSTNGNGMANLPVGPTPKVEAPKVNDAQTLSTVVKGYADALKTKNDAALRKVLSASTIKGWEEEMKSEGKTKLAEYIASSEYVEGKPYELRNEEIKGDEAVAEIKGGSFGVWSKIKFVKENGEWKMTDESPEFIDVQKNANKSQQIAPK